VGDGGGAIGPRGSTPRSGVTPSPKQETTPRIEPRDDALPSPRRWNEEPGCVLPVEIGKLYRRGPPQATLAGFASNSRA